MKRKKKLGKIENTWYKICCIALYSVVFRRLGGLTRIPTRFPTPQNSSRVPTSN